MTSMITVGLNKDPITTQRTIQEINDEKALYKEPPLSLLDRLTEKIRQLPPAFKGQYAPLMSGVQTLLLSSDPDREQSAKALIQNATLGDLSHEALRQVLLNEPEFQ